MGKSSSPPAAPNYSSAAQQQNASEIQDYNIAEEANRPDVATPFGGETWTNSGTSTNPDWSETQTLTGPQQTALTGQQNIQANQTGLAGTLEGQVNSTMAGGLNAPSLSSYMDAVSPLNESYTGFNPTESGVGGVNTVAPQYSSATAAAGTKAAYDAEMGLVQPGEQQQTQSTENQLKLQGLTPGTEAYNNAVTLMNSGQNQENTTIANNAVQTGDEEAQQNYQEALAGYNAGNTAQDQAYTQAMDTYGTGQTAESNEAALQGQENTEGNTNYDSAYTAALNNYMEPLTAMDSVLNGESVQNPNTTATNNGTEQGASGAQDLTAATDLGSYDQGIYNTQEAASSQGLGALGSLAGDAAMVAMV